MTDPLAALTALGEVAHVTTLRGLGLTDDALRAGVRSGAIDRIRRGWYASPEADAEQRRAVLIHGKLGCATALERFGVWSGTTRLTHIQVATNAARLRRTVTAAGTPVPGVWHPATPDRRRRDIRLGDPMLAPIVHWGDECRPAHALDWIVSPSAALAQAIRCLPPEHAQAAIDSAVAERLLPRNEVERIVAGSPTRLNLVVDDLSARLESGVESLFVRRLIHGGHRVEPQFDFGTHGRFDGIIDGCVLYEIDGWRHHSSRRKFHSDRERTLVGQAFGMPVIRPSAMHVLNDWPLVAMAVARTVHDTQRLRRLDGRPIVR